MLVGVQDIHYVVHDMERAVAFYRDTLGMQVLDSNRWWTSLEFFGTRIGLHAAGQPTGTAVPHDALGPRAGASLTLRSTDLDADLDHLRRRGVKVLGRSDNPWGRLAACLDSEGNVFKLMQPPVVP